MHWGVGGGKGGHSLTEYVRIINSRRRALAYRHTGGSIDPVHFVILN